MPDEVVQDQDWMKEPPWPWPTVKTKASLLAKLKERNIDVEQFKDSRTYRYWRERLSWLEDL